MIPNLARTYPVGTTAMFLGLVVLAVVIVLLESQRRASRRRLVDRRVPGHRRPKARPLRR